jgi:hypothetical protein
MQCHLLETTVDKAAILGNEVISWHCDLFPESGSPHLTSQPKSPGANKRFFRSVKVGSAIKK